MAKPKTTATPKKKTADAASGIWTNTQLLGILLAALSFIVYANTLNHNYALDDVAVIWQNKFVKSGIGGIPDILTTFYWQGYWNQNAGLYRPLSLVMFAVEWQLFPNQPWFGHLVNVLLYALCAWLLFRLLLRLFPKLPPVFAFTITLLFALHPVHTEVVANIKSRDEILCFLFFLLSVQALLRYISHRRLADWIWAGVHFLLALLAKEGALLFIFIYPLILFFFTHASWKTIGKTMIPLAIILALWFGLHEWVIAHAPENRRQYTYVDNSLVAADGILQRTATAFTIMGRYLLLLVYPHPLSYDYSYSQVPNVGWGSPSALVSLLVCLGLGFVALKELRKRSVVSFSILFFFITLSLTSNIVVLIGATMADRFLFTPSLGFCIAAVYLVYHYWARKKKPQMLVTVFVPVLVLFGYKTFTRNQDWVNDYTLFLHDVKSAPNSSRVHYNAATALLGPGLRETNPDKKQAVMDQVIAELEQAIKLDSAYIQAWNNYGVALYHRKLYDRSIAASRKVIALNPKDVSVFGNLADAYFMSQGFDSAIVYYNKSIEANSTYKDTYNRLGSAYFSKQQFDKAIETYVTGLQKDSLYSDLWLNLGNAYGATQQYLPAIASFEKAYALNSANPQPLYFIAMTYEYMGDKVKAQEYLNRFNATQQKTSP